MSDKVAHKVTKYAGRCETPATPCPRKRPAPTKDELLRGAFYKQRKLRERPTVEDQEVILACFLLTENLAAVSRATGWSTDQIQRVVRDAETAGYLHDLRMAHREQFVSVAWDAIMLAVQTVHDGLRKGYVSGRAKDENGEDVWLVSQVGPGEAAGVLQKLHHAVQLHEGKPTSIVEEVAERVPRDQLLAEIRRLYEEVTGAMGQLQ